MGKFILDKKINLNSMKEGEAVGESDLAIQVDFSILQFKYKEDEDERRRLTITPGIYDLQNTPNGVVHQRTEFSQKKLLTGITNTTKILEECNVFFSNLDIYERLEVPKKRGILLYSAPGFGKTSTIVKFAHDLIEEDPNTVIINWGTSTCRSDSVEQYFTHNLEYDKKCSRVVLVIEDIGGGERERNGYKDAVDSSLLNILDGLNNVFKLPTLIVATTNYPQNLLGALSNRPGRFDLMLELSPPSYEERIALAEFISKRALTEGEKEALSNQNNKGIADFSPAHIKEMVIRSELKKKSFDDVIKEMIYHVNKQKNDFEAPKGRMGF
jgi:AAA+ superfamily predicted ATPase